MMKLHFGIYWKPVNLSRPTKRQLQGRLKEIAAEFDEEDNPMIMTEKHKK